jgi:ABC-type molybdate transport system substrate-binding protein
MLSVLSAGAVRRGVTGVIRMFDNANNVKITVQFTSAPKVRARVLAGEQADVVIASASALDALEKEGRIVASSRTLVGRTGMAVALRMGKTIADFSSKESFRRAMLDVDILAYNQGSSGAHAAVIVDQLGLRQALGSKVCIVQNGAEMFELITTNPGMVVGLANVSNILDQIEKGLPVMLAGHFPDELQNVTTYQAAVVVGAGNPALSEAFVRTFVSVDGSKMLAETGLDQG